MDAVLTTTVALPWSREIAWVKKELTITAKATSPIGTPATLQMYEIHNDKIVVPKNWALMNAAKLGITSVQDQQYEAQVLKEEESALNSSLTLRPHQAEAVEAIMQSFHKEPLGGGALLCLPCGYGKSVTALAVAARLQLKTLIIVNTTVLASQWKNVIAQYVPGSRVGLIQQNKFIVDDMTHVVAVAHTVAKGRYDFSTAGFNYMIVDEAHRTCCNTLSKCFAVAGCRYRLALTATPIRPDGFNTFLKYAIGDIAFRLTGDKRADLRVYSINLSPGTARMHTIRAGGKMTPCIAKIMNDLQPQSSQRAVERQEVAAQWIKLCASKRRQILVVADRICMLEDLVQRLDPLPVAFLIGKTKPKDRETAKDATVILASYAVASEGLDINSLDTLLLLTPRSGSNCIVQCVGRLLRTGGRSPLVIDFVDDLQVFHNMQRKRCIEYRKMGAVITKWGEDFIKT